MSSRFFYQPEQGVCGDFIPFYWQGTYYLFFLQGQALLDVSLITTVDFLNYTEHGIVIFKGDETSQDRSIGTGCVYERAGVFYFIYTGFNADFLGKAEKFEQVLMRATSSDLLIWCKDPDWRLSADSEHYCGLNAWRDPHVFRNEETNEHWMILTTQVKEGPAAGLARDRRTGLGCIGLLKSNDFTTWESQAPIFKPGIYDAMECPDLFQIGDWWYLTFSEYRDLWSMHYRMAKSPLGPWISPKDDSLDVRAFYAGKTAGTKDRRLMIGWVAHKEGQKDRGYYKWGGSLMVHELVQQLDGTLGIKLPREIISAFDQTLLLSPKSELGKWSGKLEHLTLEAVGELTYLTLAEIPNDYMITVNIDWEKGTRACGLLLHMIDGLDDGYLLYLEPERGLLKFENWLRPWDYPTLECQVELQQSHANVKVVRTGTIIVIHLDDKKAMSGRAYDLQLGKLGLFVSEGGATFTDISLQKISE